MKDYLTLGPAPCDEDCAQVGRDDYHKRYRREGDVYIRQLRRMHGVEPTGARLTLKSFPHDFGTYHEVCVVFEDDIPEAVEYAFKVEADLPATWDDEARRELGVIDNFQDFKTCSHQNNSDTLPNF